MTPQLSDITNLTHDIDSIHKLDWYLSHSVTASYTFTDDDKIKTLYMTTGASVLVATLPTAADNKYRVIEIFKEDSGAGSITVDGEGAETINGLTNILLIAAQYHGVRIKSNGTSWRILDWIKPYEKQYIAGDTYNSVTITISGVTLVRGVLKPYQTIDGAWRMTFNFVVTFASAATATIGIAGVTFKNVGSYNQAVTSYIGSTAVVCQSYAQLNTGNIVCSFGDNRTYVCVSGDVELENKPSWAD